jgi:opacity protein-like surface antigen
MNKKIVFSLCFVFFSFSVLAQEIDVDPGTSFGVFAGAGNINHVSDAPFPYSLPHNPGVGESFLIGVFLDVPLGENIFFNPELNYLSSNKSTGYLEVAPLLKYTLFNSNFNVLAGPQATIIVTELNEDFYRRTGFELAGGLGYDFGSKWFVQAKYAYELTNRYKEKVPAGGSEMHFETWTVGVGFKF